MALAHPRLSVFYRTLSRQLEAGIALAQALRAPSPAPAADRLRLAALAESGRSVGEILAAAGEWLPREDRRFLVAAAGAGRMPQMLVRLADRHERLGAARRRVVLASLYPLAVFHLGAAVFSLVRLIDFEEGFAWSAGAFFGRAAAIILPVWGGALLFCRLVRGGNRAAHALLDRLPAVGGYRRDQALADFAFALGRLLEAGAPIDRAWAEAGEMSRSPRLRRAAEEIRRKIGLGLAPGAHLGAAGAFPDDFAALYRAGEAAGSLEASLSALAAGHQERADGRLAAASVLYPGLLFAAVAAMVCHVVAGFALRYLRALEGLMQP